MSLTYGWFSPVKGPYPGLGQEDHTARVKLTNPVTTFVRGTILKLNADGEWELPSGTDIPTDTLYIALQGTSDRQAMFAGASDYLPGSGLEAAASVESDPKAAAILRKSKKAGPAVTGLSLVQSGEYEIAVNPETVDETVKIGDNIYVAVAAGHEGELTCASTSGGKVGVVTAAPYFRYCNDAPIDGTENQGSNVWVVRFRTF